MNIATCVFECHQIKEPQSSELRIERKKNKMQIDEWSI